MHIVKNIFHACINDSINSVAILSCLMLLNLPVHMYERPHLIDVGKQVCPLRKATFV